MPPIRKGFGRLMPIAAVALALAAVEYRTTQAHTGVTSPYNFNKDVFPVFRDQCGACHYAGGPAPMSLLVHKDEHGSGASAWGRSILDYLITEQMPPWYVDPLGPVVKGGYKVPPRDLDKMLTWAGGGTPEGEEKDKPHAATPPSATQWKAGPPDLKLMMAAEHELPAGTIEDTKEFVLDPGLKEEKWVRGIDLLPGTPSMVRSATISIDGPQGSMLSPWVPGTDPIMAPNGAAFRLAPGTKIRLEVFYRKSYLDEQSAVKDRSTVGFYFTDAPVSGREIQSMAISGASAASEGAERTASGTLKSAARVVALTPALDQPYVTLKVDAVTPTGRRVPLLWLRAPRPEWRRRYWLAEPLELPSGTKIEVNATPFPPDSDLPRSPKTYPFQVALDIVPQ